jgi:DNA-binding transcriptional regulator/RsmH inhibitor MraZ
MKSFQGSTLSKLDESGRLKLPPNVVADFKSVDPTGNVSLKYLPEGAIFIKPANQVSPEPSLDSDDDNDYEENDEMRIRLRQRYLLNSSDTISPQGRLTLPLRLLKRIGVDTGEEIALVGVGKGYEVWKPEALEEELDKELAQRRHQYEQKRDKTMD